jgi:pentatricopeptide repeat protein
VSSTVGVGSRSTARDSRCSLSLCHTLTAKEYSQLLHSLTRARKWREALRVTADMREEGVTPSAQTCNDLMQARGLPLT